MTDAGALPLDEEAKIQDDHNKHPVTFLCVDKKTFIIYEAQYIQDFVMVRPATPHLYNRLTKMSFVDFCQKFDEFEGNVQTISQGYGDLFVSFDTRRKPQPEKK